ncbi:MAG: phenylalanine--tRNA ligase subunit alpha [Planctomycetes bacterium]|nr:phenylalanine--tRNA ligase subunit alpha [Planctomycetota bacterium]
MQTKLAAIGEEALAAIQAAGSAAELEKLRVKYLGRKGVFRDVMADLKSLPPEEKPKIGQAANRLKKEIAAAIDNVKKELQAGKGPAEPTVTFDPSLPGRRPNIGHRHPITQMIDRIKDIFGRMGFSVAYGPDVDYARNNFEALNIPPDHPSRDAFDTFYFDKDVVLRSQTSTVQIRVMENQPPPVRVIAPGKTYRPDTVDATHCFMFHQVEGLYVDEGVTMADLKAVLTMFAREFFYPDVTIRFRPHFFPFTEPSVEVDVSCAICGGKGCSVCSRKGWIEFGGAGMVDPNVFEGVGYDAEKYTGFAFGLGIDRLVMMKYGIDDIRRFFENDMRFLSQF